jgi:uncharacterized protein (TIGR02118 family)
VPQFHLMLKFMVVVYRRPEFTPEQFRDFFRNVHGPLAGKIPGLRRYKQNFTLPDPKRQHPGWDAVIELFFDDKESMEVAWQTPEGQAATQDLANCADLSRTTWSVVEEMSIRS